MRQVIKTNQNFVTGEHYEQRMLKPEQPSRNRITVQLCDAETGKVVEEAITENAMSPCYESYAYGCIAEAISRGKRIGDLQSLLLYPTSIILTDSDKSELEDLYFVHGTPVGSVNRTDATGSADNPYKGTYNSAESYDKFEDNYYRHIHLVYDWPTSAGNGKIQSIFWKAAPVLQTTQANQKHFVLSLFNLATPYDNANMPCFKDDVYTYIYFDKHGNTYFYDKNEDKYYKVLNQLPYLMGIESKKLATEPEAIYSECEVNGCYYTVTSSYDNKNTSSFSYKMTITKYDTKGNVLDSWDEDLITPIPNLVELRNNAKLGTYNTSDYYTTKWIGYCDDDGWIGLSVGYSTNGTLPERCFPLRNSAGDLDYNKQYSTIVYTMYNVLTKQWLRLPNPWDVWTSYAHWTNCTFIKKLTDKNIVMKKLANQGIEAYLVKVTYDNVEGLQISTDLVGNSSSISNTFLHRIHATLPFAVTRWPSTTGIMQLLPLVAHTRLAAPITKTSLNTMKIQYDFFFKVPVPTLPPDKCWDLYKTE